jgi:cytochrome c oxidase cbb3-type subunit 3
MRFLSIATIAIAARLLAQEPKPDPAAIERGRTEFKSSCGFCHGDDATGNRAPDLVRSVSLMHDAKGDTLGPVIRNGRADKGMPAFASLTAAQIDGIVLFLHHQLDVALGSNHVPADYPLAKLLTGNAKAGETFFNGAGGCAKCHSLTGDLKGIANKYPPLELQQRMLYPPKAPKPSVTVRLKSGETIEGTLAHTDEFEIAITDRDGWHRSWSRDRVTVEIRDPLAAHKALMPKYTDADVHNLFAFLASQK